MRFLLYFVLFSALFLTCFLVNGAAVQQEEEEIQRLRSNILALDRIQTNIRQEIMTRKAAGTLSTREGNELLVFVHYLQDRNSHYCKELERKAGHHVDDLPCPENAAAQLPSARVRTMDEELADLDRELAESIGAFDEMLLKEQERVAARQPNRRESGSMGGAGGTGGKDQGHGGEEGVAAGGAPTDQKAVNGDDSGAMETAAAGEVAQKSGGAGAVSRSGRDRLSVDDDIVARQLREAAEKETDPELKEKLWEEYRKYKAGL